MTLVPILVNWYQSCAFSTGGGFPQLTKSAKWNGKAYIQAPEAGSKAERFFVLQGEVNSLSTPAAMVIYLGIICSRVLVFCKGHNCHMCVRKRVYQL